MPTHQLDQTKFLTPDEWGRLESIARRELGTERERNGLLLLIAFRSGARAGEVLNLAPSDFFEREGSLLIRGSSQAKPGPSENLPDRLSQNATDLGLVPPGT